MLINRLPQILSFTTRHHHLIIIGVLAIILIIAYLISQQTPPTAPPQAQLPADKAAYQPLAPGQTSHQQIINQLGVPTDIFQQDGYAVYMYPSTTSHFQPDLLYLKDDTLVLKELFYTPIQYDYPLQKVLDDYGQPDQILFQPASPIDQAVVYPYPQSGTSFFVRRSTNQIFKQQQFPPISLDTYRQTWGQGLLDTQPTPIPHLHPEEHIP